MRRSGVSLKVSDSSANCGICKNVKCEYSCLICKKILCEYCICDNQKYCIRCDNKDITDSNISFIRVPTNVEGSNIIVVKKRKWCCFM